MLKDGTSNWPTRSSLTLKRLKICKAFEEAFTPKDIKDRACQTVYSLSMDQFNGDFNEYSTTFKLAQACSGVDDSSILIDALQRGVTQQLTIMMTATALPDSQERLVGNENSGLTKLESFTEMWYDLGNSEEGETAISCQLEELPALIPTPWMWTRSIALLVKEQST